MPSTRPAAPALVAAGAPAPRLLVAMAPGGTVEVHAGPQALAAGTARGQFLTESGQAYPYAFFSADGRFSLSTPTRRLEGFAAGRYLLQMENGTVRPFEIQAGAVTAVVVP